jgi:hypothetical protein
VAKERRDNGKTGTTREREAARRILENEIRFETRE